jgi:hypothetical protein
LDVVTYEAPPEVRSLSIAFTRHVVERKTTRDDWLVRTNTYRETRKKIPEVEQLLREKGRWFRRFDEEEKLMKCYCIVNNLEVYCGVILDDEEIIVITTYYPYTQKMKRRLFPRRFENYQRFILEKQK